MKLSEYKNEEAIELLADILLPASVIINNKDVQKVIKRKKKTIIEVAQAILKNCPQEIIQVLARLDNVPVDEYECSIFTLPIKVLEIINDDDLIDFFISQSQTLIPSGSAMENTKETEET